MIRQYFDYTRNVYFPGLIGLPFVSVTLIYRSNSVPVQALVDSGSTVSVLPYDIGLQLGLVWEEQHVPAPLVGVLKDAPAWGVLLSGEISPFPPVTLAFAWTRKSSDEALVILGQTNFFQTFKTAFDGKSGTFEIILPAA